MISDAIVILEFRYGNPLFPSHKITENKIAFLYPEKFLPTVISSVHRAPVKNAVVEALHTNFGIFSIWLNPHRPADKRRDLGHRTVRRTVDNLPEGVGQHDLGVASGCPKDPPSFLHQPRHLVQLGDDPALFGEGRERNLIRQYVIRSNGGIIRGATSIHLFKKIGRLAIPVEKPSQETPLINLKKKIVPADNGTIKFLGDDPVPAHLGVNLRDKEFSGPANLLFLRLYRAARYTVAQDDAAGRRLNPTSGIRLIRMNGDELLSVPN